MLSPLPDLLILSLLGVFVLRVVVGVIFLTIAYSLHTKKIGANIMPSTPIKIVVGIYTLVGLLFVIGLYTQISAIVGFILSSIAYFSSNKSHQVEIKLLYALLAISSLCFVTFGAGVYALDLPL